MGKKSDSTPQGLRGVARRIILNGIHHGRRGENRATEKSDSVYSLDHFFLKIVGCLSVWLSFCITGTASTAFS